jgi:hypothetical protein
MRTLSSAGVLVSVDNTVTIDARAEATTSLFASLSAWLQVPAARTGPARAHAETLLALLEGRNTSSPLPSTRWLLSTWLLSTSFFKVHV